MNADHTYLGASDPDPSNLFGLDAGWGSAGTWTAERGSSAVRATSGGISGLKILGHPLGEGRPVTDDGAMNVPDHDRFSQCLSGISSTRGREQELTRSGA